MTTCRGFTLVEAVIGLALVGSVCATTALALVASRAMSVRARHETIGAVTASARLAELASLAFGIAVGPSGDPVDVTDTTSDLSSDPPGGGGPGLTPSPADALWLDQPGYADYLDETGRALGGGADVRTGAAYVRRWAIVREGRGAGEVVSFAVLVAPIALADRLAAEGPPDVPRLSAQPGVVCLRGARSRHAS
jgi:type II secretory pathway pseudopilin PulG